jgi:hypothetical protein
LKRLGVPPGLLKPSAHWRFPDPGTICARLDRDLITGAEKNPSNLIRFIPA